MAYPGRSGRKRDQYFSGLGLDDNNDGARSLWGNHFA